MGRSRHSKASRQLSGREQERVNRQAKLLALPPDRVSGTTESERLRRAAEVRSRRGNVTCAWCGATIEMAARGRPPKWCSATCRHRAWEQRRAAASGLAAVEVVERPVEVVRTVTRVERVVVEASRQTTPASAKEWTSQLEALAEQLDRGRIYDRDVAALLPAMTAVVAAFNRRHR